MLHKNSLYKSNQVKPKTALKLCLEWGLKGFSSTSLMLTKNTHYFFLHGSGPFIMDGHDGRVVNTVALQQAYNRLDPHLCLCAFSHAFSHGTKTSIRLTGDSEYAVGMR